MENDLHLIFWLGTAMTLCLFILVVVLTYIYQKGMIRQLEEQNNIRIQVEYQQMQLLSQEIHDGICSDLAAVLRYFEHYEKTNNNNQDPFSITPLQELIQLSYQNALNLSYNLYPLEIEQYNMVDLIQQYIYRIQKISLLPIEFTTNEQSFQLSKTQKIELYRSLQEILQNILKHSKATKVSIATNWSDNHLILQIKDNGIAYDFIALSKEKKGLGLLNVLARTKHIKATLSCKSQEGNNQINIKINKP